MKKLIITTLFAFAAIMGWADLIYGPYAPGAKISVTIDALVGYAAKGLPSGLKLDKKTGTISGTPKKPTGEAGAKVTFTKKGAETLTATFIVSDWPQISVACSGLTNQTFTVGVAGTGESIPVEIEPLSAVKSVTASKLPSDMKLVKDKTTGAWSITGAPKKAGTYNVALTVTTVYGNKQTLTIPMTVEALPSWVAGTWEVYSHVDDGNPDIGRIVLSIAANGSASALCFSSETKVVRDPKKTLPTLICHDSGTYLFDWNYQKSKGSSYHIRVVITCQEIEGQKLGTVSGASYRMTDPVSQSLMKGNQNGWKTFAGTPMAPTFAKNAMTTIDLSDFGENGVCDGRLTGCSLTLKYGKNGAVTAAFFEAGAKKAAATCSAQLTPYDYDSERQVVKAFVTPMLSPKNRHSIGIVLFLEIDVSQGSVRGDDVIVRDYLLEDN